MLRAVAAPGGTAADPEPRRVPRRPAARPVDCAVRRCRQRAVGRAERRSGWSRRGRGSRRSTSSCATRRGCAGRSGSTLRSSTARRPRSSRRPRSDEVVGVAAGDSRAYLVPLDGAGAPPDGVRLEVASGLGRDGAGRVPGHAGASRRPAPRLRRGLDAARHGRHRPRGPADARGGLRGPAGGGPGRGLAPRPGRRHDGRGAAADALMTGYQREGWPGECWVAGADPADDRRRGAGGRGDSPGSSRKGRAAPGPHVPSRGADSARGHGAAGRALRSGRARSGVARVRDREGARGSPLSRPGARQPGRGHGRGHAARSVASREVGERRRHCGATAARGRACSFSRGPWLARRPGRWSWRAVTSTRLTSPRCTSPRGSRPWLSGRVPRAGELSPRRRSAGSSSKGGISGPGRNGPPRRRDGTASPRASSAGRFAETQVACGSEELVNRQVVTLELNPVGAARAWALWGAWYDCRWKAMGEAKGGR